MYSVLFVDDDVQVLKSYKRALASEFKVHTAGSPEEGLRLLSQQSFPVVVSDMKMPGMNGIDMLHQAQLISPDTVRVLLTGYADQQTAIDAVNRGNVFRFLTKPCAVDTLTVMLKAAIRQYQLVVSEREVLEQTLLGTVSVLSQILTLINPVAQGKATRLKLYCRHMASTLQLPDKWLVEMAAMLSQLGCLTIPPEIMSKYLAGSALDKTELQIVREHPVLAAKLLAQIPRLENVVEIIAAQDKTAVEIDHLPGLQEENIRLGCRILQVAAGLDRRITQGLLPEMALQQMLGDPERFDADLISLMSSYDFGLQNMVRMQINAKELNSQMILDEDVRTRHGLLLASRGQKVTIPVLSGIINYSSTIGVVEPFAVLVPLVAFGQNSATP